MRLHGLVTELAKDAYELAPPKLHRKSRHVELRWKVSGYSFVKLFISDRLLLYFADSASIKTTKTTKTKPAISENIVWNGCPWK